MEIAQKTWFFETWFLIGHQWRKMVFVIRIVTASTLGAANQQNLIPFWKNHDFLLDITVSSGLCCVSPVSPNIVTEGASTCARKRALPTAIMLCTHGSEINWGSGQILHQN